MSKLRTIDIFKYISFSLIAVICEWLFVFFISFMSEVNKGSVETGALQTKLRKLELEKKIRELERER